MARLRSCAAEHDRAGVGPVDGSREAIGGEFRNETCDGPKLDHFPRTALSLDSLRFCLDITLKSMSVEGRVSAFKILDIYASAY